MPINDILYGLLPKYNSNMISTRWIYTQLHFQQPKVLTFLVNLWFVDKSIISLLNKSYFFSYKFLSSLV